MKKIEVLENLMTAIENHLPLTRNTLMFDMRKKVKCDFLPEFILEQTP